jgi:hypothetical protein
MTDADDEAWSRLTTIDPSLVAALDAAQPTQRRAASLAAVAFAVTANASTQPILDAALQVLRVGSLADTEILTAVNELVSQLDDHYFSLAELAESGGASQDTVLVAFQQARAANALAFALAGQADEAIYEAFAATNDVAGLRKLVVSALPVSSSEH